MSTMKAVFVYWKQVFKRALKDATNFLGTNPKKILVTAILMFIAVYFLYRAEGCSAAFAKVEWWLMLLVAEAGLVFIVFLSFLLLIPYQLYKEAQEKCANVEEAFEAMTAEIEKNENDDPQKKVIRSEFKTRREGFVRIENGLRSHDVSSVENFYNLDWETYSYIQSHVPGYTRYGKKYAPQNIHTHKICYTNTEFDAFADRCQNRIDILDELLAMHS
jgi:hypothetical protein